jgi:DNA polymerase I-like protein with 3'-5' exonuclease and polymerase domains|tara:strand:- start:2603 stop:4465 length:1863 start_codon:yes stop_codon:yes gene_type:complete
MIQMPLFKPQTEWLPPEEFPDLSKYDEISIDLETKDPNLNIRRGSGSVVGVGEIVGIAVAVKNWCGYYPIAHEGGGNMDRGKVLKWFQDVLDTPATKIFHNAMYDVCWIRALGLSINGKIVDTMIASALVDENQMRYDLNNCSKRYTGKGKNETDLYAAAKDWGVDAKAEMYKLPAIYVGAYAEKDAEITLELWQELKKEILHQDLNSIFQLETDLFPCLVDMRFLGVRVDIENAHKLKTKLVGEEEQCLLKIKKETQVDVQIWAARSIAKVFDKLHLPYDRTDKTNSPSFTKNFLQNHPHPLVKNIARAREINKAHTTFIDTIIKHSYKGRIHAEINQLRGDNGGTVTGRFSYSNPNLQQIPARNKELGPAIRSLFIPEEGHTWGCFDYSQQEPRLVVHYATLQNLYGVDEVLEAYREGDADFHDIVADMAEIPRSQAKTINLGLFYGMGKNKLQAELGVSKEKAEGLFRQYHSKVPFVKQLMDNVMRRAENSGKIRTLLGRLCRFHLWEPNQFGIHKALPHEAALTEHGPGIKRAFTYKALNKLIQGSAADMTKKAMLELHKEGIIPHIQVHDELDISVVDNTHAKHIKEIMEDAVSLEIPNKVDYESGPNWGTIKEK